jgi:acetoacetyl-CoA synthetase
MSGIENHEILWQPQQDLIQNSIILKFVQKYYPQFVPQENPALSYHALHKESLRVFPEFWAQLAEFAELEWQLRPSGTLISSKGFDPAGVFTQAPEAQDIRGSWFPGARLNYAENLLKYAKKTPEAVALYSWQERLVGESDEIQKMSFKELHAQVSRCVQALQSFGVTAGDRVAAYLPNGPEAIIAYLACASLGAIWSSASPDFGVQGVLDRFSQIEPKFLFVCESYVYNQKLILMREKNEQVRSALTSLIGSVKIPRPLSGHETKKITGPWILWESFLEKFKPKPISFFQAPFDHPLAILFSSGTTGIPKCIVHGQGGTLLQHIKEHRLHSNIQAGDCLFYFSTLGWMMWNWLVSGLASGASLMLYDGAPLAGDGLSLFRYASHCGCTHFGTSAKFIESVLKMNLKITHSSDINLEKLRTVFSTGSPLSPAGFKYVYENIKPDVHLASISGGTDIVSCFVLGNPWSPVVAGEIQGAGLGMDVQVLREDGTAADVDEKGELVCATAFPSMPVGFWQDSHGAKYKAAYFESFKLHGKSIWCHGDYIYRTPRGGFVILGRSDAVLNPGGVRIGTAEIYRQVEKIPEVLEALVVGQDWQNDVRVILFVKLKDGLILSQELQKRIKDLIRKETTPRHVPAVIIEVPDIPRTKSGKLLELAVRNVIHGRAVKNTEAMANPESLVHFQNRVELD